MQEVFINGHAGRLEGRFHRSENPRAPVALIMHPHPSYGGTMNNRVTYATFQAFVNMGFSVLRFNYRGVGYSQGVVDGTAAGELADAIIALDWLQTTAAESTECWIAGYSFWSYIAAQVLMRRPEIKGFVFISPPVDSYGFEFLSPCPASGLIIQGNKDEFITESSVLALAEHLAAHQLITIDYKVVDGGDHTYSQNLKEVYDLIIKTVPEIKAAQAARAMKKVKAAVSNDDYWEDE
jgi:alpha/beta superfamily hydrolase